MYDEQPTRESRDSKPSGNLPSEYDRMFAMLADLPDVVRTKPTIKRVVPMLGVGGITTFVVQTIRQSDKGDLIFLEVTSKELGHIQLVIPSSVADTFARQRESVTAMLRRKLARQKAADRKLRGEKPGFKMTAEERAEAKARREAKG